MCGIMGYIGSKKASETLLNGIKRLQYRGYDSVGMVVQQNSRFTIKKGVGSVDEVHSKLNFIDLRGKMGMAHTRWSTHGGVTDHNAHPHLSHNKKVVIIHNGIIENFESMKSKLEPEGYKFVSETDSEVIAHYIEHQLHVGKSVPEAISAFMHDAQGTFAVLFMLAGDDSIYAMRRDSPLVLGIGKDANYIASDIYAFSNLTNKAVFFENNEWAVVKENSYNFYDINNKELKKEVKTFVWEDEKESKKTFQHFMLKEIMEEPITVRRLLLSLGTDQKAQFEELVSLIKQHKKVFFVAAGTSYHATLLGVYYLHKCGLEAQTIIASEFEHFATVDNDTLVIAFSQSGETMDVIDALKYAKAHKAKIASVVNVPYSTVQRMSDLSFNILAGQEVCVAATKSFVNQMTLLLKLAEAFGYKVIVEDLPIKIGRTFDQLPSIKKIAEEISEAKDIYILGRGLSYPVAREIALKIKEISYIHAEGMMGGELKHGTIALIEDGVPVICLLTNGDPSMLSNIKEVEARGAKTITIGTKTGNVIINTDNDGTFGVLAAIVGQLLTYYIALKKNLPIDRPKNLAKSVTVR